MEIAGFVGMSHSPSWDLSFDQQGPGQRFIAAVAQARRMVRDLDCGVLVVFGPDHHRNFFYDLMPAFCIGAGEVRGFGDYSSPSGPLPGYPQLGRFVVERTMAAGFDPAVSLNMGVDHGVTQAYAALAADGSVRLLPIMVNCAGGPMASLRRCHQFGRAVGEAIRAFPGNGRVVAVGSGGLSHSPPSASPFDRAVSDDMRDYAINGRARAAEFNAARERQSIQRRKLGGVGPINTDWDRWFLGQLARADLAPVLDVSAEDLLRDAGIGGQEVRAWVAAIGAWGGVIEQATYDPTPTWITGMACATAAAPPTTERAET
jgi:2,3-dihydroxyphenylpropionate 1,2-dioxygenase